jgi:hypothetical protein
MACNVRRDLPPFANHMLHLSITPFPIGSLGPLALFPALFTEICVFYLAQRRTSQSPAGPEPFVLIFIVLLLVNLVPIALGYILLGVTHHSELLVRLSIGSFLVSWALSVTVEYAICRKLRALKDIRYLLMTLAISNVAGYAALALLVWRMGPLAAH